MNTRERQNIMAEYLLDTSEWLREAKTDSDPWSRDIAATHMLLFGMTAHHILENRPEVPPAWLIAVLELARVARQIPSAEFYNSQTAMGAFIQQAKAALMANNPSLLEGST